jgi:dTDP-4-dehydrorhamnose 3,5-epimerase
MLIEPSPISDDRGFFIRLFDAASFAAQGMAGAVAQTSLSFNTARGTLRGLHFQAHPRPEDKLVRCGRGRIFDVAVDVRPGSPTFGQWFGTELSDGNNLQLFIPAGFAHGFQALTDEAVVLYQISTPYEAALSAGLRFDDPDVAIEWPLEPVNLSPRDQALPRLRDLSADILTSFDPSSS